MGKFFSFFFKKGFAAQRTIGIRFSLLNNFFKKDFRTLSINFSFLFNVYMKRNKKTLKVILRVVVLTLIFKVPQELILATIFK